MREWWWIVKESKENKLDFSTNGFYFWSAKIRKVERRKQGHCSRNATREIISGIRNNIISYVIGKAMTKDG